MFTISFSFLSHSPDFDYLLLSDMNLYIAPLLCLILKNCVDKDGY